MENGSIDESQEHTNENESDSDDSLKIVINSPKKRTAVQPTQNERRIIASIEDELERRLEEKAAKTNLNAIHVKNIIKHVVTNEHVLALVRKVENPDDEESGPLFEPKLTRSKAKELLTTPDIISPIVSLTPVAWSTPVKTSDTRVLLDGELQEDSSGDEYDPREDESEDDRESSLYSDSSVPPPTPPTPTCISEQSQIQWSEDGVFKIPQPKIIKQEVEDEATIAKRTRSKLSLSATPLEVIEEAFIPPDITTDMYDMECDNDDWRDFLKKFTRPLDEIVKPSEDEDHDPEYNILADEETEEFDREELRMDKGVKITKKELNNLIAELFEFATSWTNNNDESNTVVQDSSYNSTLIPQDTMVAEQSRTQKMDDEESHISITSDDPENTEFELINEAKQEIEIEEVELENVDYDEEEEQENRVSSEESNLFSLNYLYLLTQQMTQHVQMLTQNFILTYRHPEIHHYSVQMKEYLLNLKFLCETKEKSMFRTVNLDKAVKLLEHWEQLLDTDSEEVKTMMRHVENTMAVSLQRKYSGSTYVVTFPKLILETISKSDVFVYPYLLPKIPFKSPRYFSTRIVEFTNSENHLIALGLDQFIPFAAEDSKFVRKGRGKLLKRACTYISEYMLPHKSPQNLYHRVVSARHNRCAHNPIKQYFQEKSVPSLIHYVSPLESFGIVPPCKRSPVELPYQWRMFLYPELENQPVSTTLTANNTQIFNLRNQANQTQLVHQLNQTQPVHQPITQPVLQPITQPVHQPNQTQPVHQSNQTQPVHQPTTLEVLEVSQVFQPDQLPQVLQQFAIPQLIQTAQPCTVLPKPQTQIVHASIQPTSTVYSSQKFRLLKPKGSVKVPVYGKKKTSKKRKVQKNDPLSKFIRCLSKPSSISKFLSFYSDDSVENSALDCDIDRNSTKKVSKPTGNISLPTENTPNLSSPAHLIMLPSMPTLSTPIKSRVPEGENSTGRNVQTKVINVSLLGESNFHQVGESSQVEFCKEFENSEGQSNVQVILCSPVVQPVQNNTEEQNSKTEDRNKNKDNINDINALLAASSKKPAVRKEPSGAEKKRAKIRREFLANLVVSAPEDPAEEKKKNEMFALQYYDKMRETLELDVYHKVMQILNDYEEGDAVELYKKIEKVLRPKYEDLADEFLLFLREKEAAAVNKLIPWIRMNNRSKFLQKLEVYFKDQPTQLKKVYKCLTELSQSIDVSMDKIKTTLLPMFKGNQMLNDLFLQNFLDEQPPLCLVDGPYETINVEECSRSVDEEVYETITIPPDTEDKYGGASCICNCHEIEDPEFKSRYRHCIKCGTKFVNGKAYIQTGRGLRPATISFLTNTNVDHNIRLGRRESDLSSRRKKRAYLSPSKSVSSPTKEVGEEDSEDEADGKKKTKKKSPRRRKAQTPKNPQKSASKKPVRASSPPKKEKSTYRKRSNSVKKSKDKKIEKVNSGTADESEKCNIDVEESQKEKIKPGATEGQIKRLAEDSAEWEEVDITPVSEEAPDIKPHSPEQQTAESESEFCEESSQDNCESDSNSSVSSYNIQSQSDSNAGDEESWKREEDKVILETFQRENDKEASFQLIADQLKNRSVPQIRNRFETLMKILMQTIGDN